MSVHQDKLIAQYQAELEERQSFIDHLLEQADGRDMNEHESELVNKATDRMTVLNHMIEPLRESVKVSNASRNRMAEIQKDLAVLRSPSAAGSSAVEYRSAGQYVLDRWQSALGVEEPRERLAIYHRAAAHQTTADNLGIIPEPVVGGLLNYVDASRPLVNALGILPVPGGRFTRPRVTQHTDVGLQAAEKAELVSRKMLITRVPVTMSTYGGYVNVARQDIDWSTPAIMDVVLNDLAGEYSIETEAVTAAALELGSIPQTPALTPTSTAAEVSAAIWKAVGAVYLATRGVGTPILAVAPDMMGVIGPLFPGVNPTNAISTGFSAGSFAQGAQGSISGVQVVMSAGLTAGTVLMLNSVSTEVYEQRLGSLQVTEPSVLGVQVAYAGYFAAVVLTAAAVIRLDAA